MQQGQPPARGESPMRSQGGSKTQPRTPVSTGQSSPKKVSGNNIRFCALFSIENVSYLKISQL